MSYVKYGELYRIIDTNQSMSDNLVKYLFMQMLRGLNALHNNGFVHRDIKPENLLINKDM